MNENINSSESIVQVIEQAMQFAVVQHQAGRLQEAEQLYRDILETQPDNPDANHNLGVLLVQTQQTEAGLPFLLVALQANPAQSRYWLSYIDALIQSGEIETARQVLAHALKQGLQGVEVDALAALLDVGVQPVSASTPDNMKAAKNKSIKLGRQVAHKGKSSPSPQDMDAALNLFNQGQYVEAAALAQNMTVRYPGHGFSWKLLGAAFQQMGRSADALQPVQKAAALMPDDAAAHCNLGAVLHELGRYGDAEASYRYALKINPTHAMSYSNLGNTLKELGRLSEAEISYNKALQINPNIAAVYSNLGCIYIDLLRFVDAELCCRRALEISPDFAEAHFNLGNSLHALGRQSEAEASFRRALQIKPDYIDALLNLGHTLLIQGCLTEAETCFRRVLQIKPDSVEAHLNLSFTLTSMGCLDEAEARCRGALSIMPDYSVALDNLLFALNYHPDKSSEEIFAAYREYDAQFGLLHRAEWRPHNNTRETQRRLKVGYVSPDFKRHPVRYFLEPLMAHHDKNAFEIYAYAELTLEDEVTAKYKGYADHWIPTNGMSDDALAERIRADGIDILVELAGHTAHNRLGVFARKPAPVSLSWLGYGYSTGLTAIDYMLTDEVSAPAGSEGLFSEQPWRLATPNYVYRPAKGMGEISPLPAASADYVTFGTMTRGIRLNHRVIRVWSEILKRVEGSRLVIDSKDYREARAQDMIAEKFAAHGISRERLQIGYHSPPWDVLRGLDIGLDCFPHNSGTTLFETLYMGVPYITLAGRPSVGRLGSTILEGVGHAEWIARTESEYVEKAVALAGDLPKLAMLRAGLRQEMQTGPLMDEVAFAHKVEAAYRAMFEKWAQGSR